MKQARTLIVHVTRLEGESPLLDGPFVTDDPVRLLIDSLAGRKSDMYTFDWSNFGPWYSAYGSLSTSGGVPEFLPYFVVIVSPDGSKRRYRITTTEDAEEE